MSENNLTNEVLRQHLADQVPGFVQALANALEKTPPELLELVEAGLVSNVAALAALGRKVIALERELALAGEDIIDRTGTVAELTAYRAANGLPND